MGRDAEASAPLSSFDVLDAILERLADRRTFPDLQEVVIAGHSAGSQFVQHNAAIGYGQAPILTEGIHTRYVVANPSVYLYLDAARPVVPAPGCANVDRWKYGLGGGMPRYAHQPLDRAELRTAYLARSITYLPWAADKDPDHHQLDRSCVAEAQGPMRLQRGIAYANAMTSAGAQNQTMLEVPGVGHHSPQMFGSSCGVFALFGGGACAPPPDAVKAHS